MGEAATKINAKGDDVIIARLERALVRNAEGSNPNARRGRMVFDFKAARVRIEEPGQ